MLRIWCAVLVQAVEDLPGLGSAQSVHPPVVRVSGRAQAELRTGEALVFVWEVVPVSVEVEVAVPA
jgi:hypothetical protein